MKDMNTGKNKKSKKSSNNAHFWKVTRDSGRAANEGTISNKNILENMAPYLGI